MSTKTLSFRVSDQTHNNFKSLDIDRKRRIISLFIRQLEQIKKEE